MAPSSESFRLASLQTMKGALPPNSMAQEITWSAASCNKARPTGVEPVKESLRTRGSCSTALDKALALEVVTTFTTPGGTPQSCMIWATAKAVSGVSVAGFNTMVQPAAKAGAILRVAIAAG